MFSAVVTITVASHLWQTAQAYVVVEASAGEAQWRAGKGVVTRRKEAAYMRVPRTGSTAFMAIKPFKLCPILQLHNHGDGCARLDWCMGDFHAGKKLVMGVFRPVCERLTSQLMNLRPQWFNRKHNITKDMHTFAHFLLTRAGGLPDKQATALLATTSRRVVEDSHVAVRDLDAIRRDTMMVTRRIRDIPVEIMEQPHAVILQPQSLFLPVLRDEGVLAVAYDNNRRKILNGFRAGLATFNHTCFEDVKSLPMSNVPNHRQPMAADFLPPLWCAAIKRHVYHEDAHIERCLAAAKGEPHAGQCLLPPSNGRQKNLLFVDNTRLLAL